MYDNEVMDFCRKFHNLSKTDLAYTFFYDETNNIRKLFLRDKQLNDKNLKPFVLGGVVLKGKPKLIDVQLLRQDIAIQDSVREIKLKHLAKGGFKQILESSKLNRFLTWVKVNEFMLHYSIIDPLYWSTVDIIDSVLAQKQDYQQYHLDLKNRLYRIIKENLSEIIRILHEYEYPNVSFENIKTFLSEILKIVSIKQNSWTVDLFRNLFSNLDNLHFLENNSSKVLIESFAQFYESRFCLFENSNHVFDNEPFIANLLESSSKSNFRFENSVINPQIQISDVLVGIIGKIFDFCMGSSLNDLKIFKSKLNGVSLQNIELLKNFIDLSDSENLGFLEYKTCIDDFKKFHIFIGIS